MGDSRIASVLRGNAALTNSLYQILSREEGNVFFSPIGVHICLAMIYQGAQEETAQVLSKILRVPEAEHIALGYKDIMEMLNSIEKVTLLMANKIYGKDSKSDSVKLIENFEKIIKEQFYGDVEFLDFDKKTETAQAINMWIEEKTRNKIRDMIKPSFIQSDTAMILINAIYFKGEWVRKFREKATTDQEFYIDENKTVNVRMMHSSDSYKYKIDTVLEAKVLNLPYEGNNISMIVILPLEKNGIKNLESKLASFDLTQLTQDLEDCRVVVSLPKFKVEKTIDLESALAEMGLGNIFDKDKASFRGMIRLNPGENLCVDKVLQKSFIEVNESGTEAAAVTVVRMKKTKCLVEEIVEYEYFEVDHPAIFMLVAHHESSMNILFYGRLSCPQL